MGGFSLKLDFDYGPFNSFFFFFFLSNLIQLDNSPYVFSKFSQILYRNIIEWFKLEKKNKHGCYLPQKKIGRVSYHLPHTHS